MRLRFSLRALFITVTGTCLLLALSQRIAFTVSYDPDGSPEARFYAGWADSSMTPFTLVKAEYNSLADQRYRIIVLRRSPRTCNEAAPIVQRQKVLTSVPPSTKRTEPVM
jgi:hypothetical protein